MSNIIPLRNTGGFTRMDNDLYEALIGADLSGRELRVALAIHRFTSGYNVDTARIPAATIAGLSGIARENVSRIISELIRQRVIYRTGGSKSPMGISPACEWVISVKNDTKDSRSKTTLSVESDTSLVSFPTHIKDRKDNIAPNGAVAAVASTLTETAAAAQGQEPPPVIVQPEPKTQEDRIPYGEIVKLYNAICGNAMPACKSLTDKRKAAIRGCWNLSFGDKKVFRDLEFWEGYFNDASESQFLTGQNGKSWRADFDFLTRASAAVKILEGTYDR